MNRPQAANLRPASAADARAMALLSRDHIEQGLTWRYTPMRMKRLIEDPEHLAVVAADDTQVSGFALMQFGDVQAHLVLLCVQPAAQRHGLGRSLLQWLLKSARVAGIERVSLEVRADNEAALAFYRRQGFAQAQWLAAYYDGVHPARRMALRLKEASG